ncbi:copper amine oxidase N-terminal domain-containing protein [Kyrpidia spormannii]|uniref:Copper amine oxidase n=2 Tax=Kyrpidia spormannii TaxID=2055160 RepID=A0ACA8ZDV8_9BACL|nr:copper amine oxidase N-terminal domain-containing protein [Kyrpidia spormannii]CAB3394962.1 Copper amine oxidase [Kyrpidia spormannii]CAB3395915.1 Copper amine oxidase [Kyrpidia spormannii]
MDTGQWKRVTAVLSFAVLFTTPVASAAGYGKANFERHGSQTIMPLQQGSGSGVGQSSGLSVLSSGSDDATADVNKTLSSSQTMNSKEQKDNPDDGEQDSNDEGNAGDGEHGDGKHHDGEHHGDFNNRTSSDTLTISVPDSNGTSQPPGIQRAIQIIKANLQKHEGKPGKSSEAQQDVLANLENWAKQQGAKTDEEADREVENTLEQAAASGQADEQVLKTLAAVKKKLQDIQGAAQALEQALKHNPADTTVLPQLREMYNALGKTGTQVFVDGLQPSFDVPPVVQDGRTLVPIRQIAEALGATVNWNQGTVTIRREKQTVTLRIGDPSAAVNGQSVTLDVPPELSGGRTLVPLRFVGEAFGMAVDYQDGIVSVHPPTGQNG